MKSKKNLGKVAAIATGTLTLGALSTNVQANELFQAQDLGSGAELRSELIQLNNPSEAPVMMNNSEIELKCGEGKCGEGKAGEDKKAKTDEKEAKTDEKEAKTDEKAKEGKTQEHKCGEGKCGEGKCGSH